MIRCTCLSGTREAAAASFAVNAQVTVTAQSFQARERLSTERTPASATACGWSVSCLCLRR